MKKYSKQLKYLMVFVLALTMACSSSENDIPKEETAMSNAKFTISGPSVNGSFEFIDANTSDEFTSAGYLYTTEDDSDIEEDHVQVHVSKSFTQSLFLLLGPTEVGTYAMVYQDDPYDFNIDIILDDLEDGFYVKNASFVVESIQISGRVVTHCKGTFTGSFYRHNLNENDVHEISGSFDFNK